MKTKLLILIFAITLLGLFFPSSAFAVTETDVPDTEAPSDSYLREEKRSIAATSYSSASASPTMGLAKSLDAWEEPTMPGENGDWSNPNNVGGPIGDVSLPVVLLILFIYFGYRGVTTSRRRNHF